MDVKVAMHVIEMGVLPSVPEMMSILCMTPSRSPMPPPRDP